MMCRYMVRSKPGKLCYMTVVFCPGRLSPHLSTLAVLVVNADGLLDIDPCWLTTRPQFFLADIVAASLHRGSGLLMERALIDGVFTIPSTLSRRQLVHMSAVS